MCVCEFFFFLLYAHCKCVPEFEIVVDKKYPQDMYILHYSAFEKKKTFANWDYDIELVLNDDVRMPKTKKNELKNKKCKNMKHSNENETAVAIYVPRLLQPHIIIVNKARVVSRMIQVQFLTHLFPKYILVFCYY